jgi:sialate O-acetylesterase
MKMNKYNRLRTLHWTGCCILLLASSLQAKVSLDYLFCDNMILQRGTAAPVWGTADPGETVTLTLGGQTVSATANAGGAWKAVFNNLPAASSLVMTVTGAGNALTVNNVAVGEVWVGSGQSNMQFLVSSLYPKDQDEIYAAANRDIRYFESPRAFSLQPVGAFLPRKYKWIDASSPENSKEWSAVSYYFAKDLNKELGVPVGVIGCSWGGTPAEPWVARDVLESAPEYKDLIDRAIQEFQNQADHVASYNADLAAWEKNTGRGDNENAGLKNGWAAPDFNDSDWTEISLDGLQNWGKLGLTTGGVLWLRKTIDVPAADAGKDFMLRFGEIGGIDTAYFNGEEAGHGGSNPPQFLRERRHYTVPGRLVKAGANVVAVRIFIRGEYRVFHGNFQAANSRAVFCSGEKFLLPDGVPASPEWRGKTERLLPPLTPELAKDMPPNPGFGAGCVPALNFNGMVSPLMPYAIKGVLWYQGESNAAFAFAYRALLPLLVDSWRKYWGIGDFPFYIVQLPNFTGAKNEPVSDQDWAVLRESQLLACKNTSNTRMSVNIDIGEAFDIHPHNKKDIGSRLSLIALADVYGRDIEWSGPLYDTMSVEGNKIRLKFTHLGGGLVAKNGPLKHFAIAGEDKKWRAGDAVIDGDSIVVSNPDLAAPVAVRYAWSANPEGCNLYNQASLPASPFRTDDWPVITQGLWYPEVTFKRQNEKALEPLVPLPPR